jgi:hypothetical protein
LPPLRSARSIDPLPPAPRLPSRRRWALRVADPSLAAARPTLGSNRCDTGQLRIQFSCPGRYLGGRGLQVDCGPNQQAYMRLRPAKTETYPNG